MCVCVWGGWVVERGRGRREKGQRPWSWTHLHVGHTENELAVGGGLDEVGDLLGGQLHHAGVLFTGARHGVCLAA